MSIYVSPYEAYPFLKDAGDKLFCDFELLTDRLASSTGLLRALLNEYGQIAEPDTAAGRIYAALDSDLRWLTEMVYHLNACLRTKYTLTDDEFKHLLEMTEAIHQIFTDEVKQFLLPSGSVRAMQAHLLRVDAKSLVRLLYRCSESGVSVDERIIDWANLLSGYYFMLAILINDVEGYTEDPFISRNYR